MVRLFHLLNRGNQVLFIIGKELIICNMHAFHENTMNSHLLTLKAHITKNRMLLSSAGIFEASLTNSVDPDQSAPVRGAVFFGSTLFASTYMFANKQKFSDVVTLLAF